MSAQLPDEAVRPTEIRRLGPAGLRVTWFDGHVSLYPLTYLRLACECAICVDEWTRERLVKPESVPDGIAIDEIKPVGRYGIQLGWSDGHRTGIYGYDHLRELCPCSVCRGQDDR